MATTLSVIERSAENNPNLCFVIASHENQSKINRTNLTERKIKEDNQV